jgi:hypothetical protein
MQYKETLLQSRKEGQERASLSLSRYALHQEGASIRSMDFAEHSGIPVAKDGEIVSYGL